MTRTKQITIADVSYCCYSLRIDLKVDDVPAAHSTFSGDAHPFFLPHFSFLTEMFDYCVCGFELGEKTEKPHLQCFCMTKEKFSHSKIANLRRHLKAHVANPNAKQPVSLVQSWSPLGLFTYCQKDDRVKHNMPDSIFNFLRDWADREKVEPRKEVLKKLAKQSKDLQHFFELCFMSLQSLQLLSLPRKRELWQIALQSALISPCTYFAEFYAPRI